MILSSYHFKSTVPEWSSDQLSGCNNTNGCTYGISSLDSGNINLENLVYDNTVGRTWNPHAYASDPVYYNWAFGYQTSTMFPMFGVTAASVNANYGSRTVAASYMTQESSIPTRPLSILGAIDGWGSAGWSLGRFGLGLVQPTARTFMGYGNNPTVWGGHTHIGYRCVGQVP